MMRAKGKPGWILVALGAVLVLLGLGIKARTDTLADPVVRRISVAVPMVDAPDTPRRIVLVSDIHVSGPDMPPTRLARIVRQVNRLRPDLILIAGDFVGDRIVPSRSYSMREIIAPLGAIDRRTTTIAVPGNHDHWHKIEPLAREIERSRIILLRNDVIEVGGLIVAGIDDQVSGHADIERVKRRLSAIGRGGVVLSHSPDALAKLAPGTGLLSAGHTHCGQIGWPWGGVPYVNIRNPHLACGVVREKGNTIITGAGLGTSALPFRLFTRPEIWVIDLRPAQTKTAAGSPRRP